MLPNFNEDQLNFCAWLMIGIAVFCFIISFFITLPYGRYSTNHILRLRFGINARLAWLLQECPSFLVPFAIFYTSDGMKEIMSLGVSPNIFLIAMFLMHYFRRSFIYPFWMKKTAPTPFLVFLIAFLLCTMNGYVQGQYHLHVQRYPKEWLQSLQFMFGSFLFFLGFAINVHSDYVVTNLRKPGETGYKIPQGGLFEYISCPNYFGEIVEWGGYWLASSSFVAFAFFFNTMVIIGTRACQHHRFYQEKFEDYPKNRKALIPFIL